MNEPSDFDIIMQGITEAAAFENCTANLTGYRVHKAPEAVDVKTIRQRLGLTQTAFAARFGFSANAVRDWEQHRRRPEAAARTLQTVIDREPEAVERALEV